MNQHDDTRQNPSNLPALKDSQMEDDNSDNLVNDHYNELTDVLQERAALEAIYNAIQSAGKDGLDKTSIKAVKLSFTLLKNSPTISTEAFDDDQISLEDIGTMLKEVGKKIITIIQKIIDVCVELGKRTLAGIDKIKNSAEDLLSRVNKRPARISNEVSNELHDAASITIDSPGILFADGELCLADCKSETEVIKFFKTSWPKYAGDQIKRALKMISEYDVESGNSDNFKANIDFLGSHESYVANISNLILPGNKQITFEYKALGPKLVDAKNTKEAPAKLTLEIRSSAEIKHTLTSNIERMRSLSELYTAESDILKEMKSLSAGIMKLEDRRSETVWKSARDDLDTITRMIMSLVDKLKPNYDPIVRHLAKIGNARNHVCGKELEARG